jgi:hypothetical protein
VTDGTAARLAPDQTNRLLRGNKRHVGIMRLQIVEYGHGSLEDPIALGPGALPEAVNNHQNNTPRLRKVDRDKKRKHRMPNDVTGDQELNTQVIGQLIGHPTR